MKLPILLLILLVHASPSHGQYGVVGNGQSFYEPEMDSVFFEWERLTDAIAEGCKVLNPCSTALEYEPVAIPYRIALRNDSEIIEVDENSLGVVLKHAISKNHFGYEAELAKIHAGPVKDTLVLMFELKDVGYRLGSYFSLGSETYLIETEVCKSTRSRNLEAMEGSDTPADLVWKTIGINEFTLGGLVYAEIVDTASCYFDFKKWPTMHDFDMRNRSTNPWYEFRYKQ